MTGDGNMASIAAVNFNNTNYVASVVCPATWQDSLTTDRIGEPCQRWSAIGWIPFNVVVAIVVYHSGLGKYALLPPTICEIVLLLTQSSVMYANQLVASTPQNTTTIPSSHNLNFWVTLFVELEEWGFQTGRLNSLGNMLLSLLTSGSASFSEAPVQSLQIFLVSVYLWIRCTSSTERFAEITSSRSIGGASLKSREPCVPVSSSYLCPS